MKKSISNFEEIKKQLKTKDLSEPFQLSEAETINNLPKFIDESLKTLNTDKLTRFHRPYFDRLVKVFKTLGIEIKIVEKK